MPLSEQLLLVARARLNDATARNEANLRRATSDLYYALFHAVSEAMVASLGGDPKNAAFIEAYVSVYRQLEHGQAEKRCKALARGDDFAVEFRRFAKHFVTMKNKREAADYGPLEKFAVSIVKNDLETTETVLSGFWGADAAERTTFACYIGLRWRRDAREQD